MYFFIVDFDERASDKAFNSLLCLLDDGEDLIEGSRDDAFILLGLRITHHSVCFSTAGLSVGEDSAVVAGDDGFD